MSLDVNNELQGREKQFPLESRIANSSVRYFAPPFASIHAAVVFPVFAKLGTKMPSSPSAGSGSKPRSRYISPKNTSKDVDNFPLVGNDREP